MNLSDIPWPTAAGLSKDTPVVIPVAALEQHGHHLPLFTDSLLLGEVVRRAAAAGGGARASDAAFVAREFRPSSRFRRHALVASPRLSRYTQWTRGKYAPARFPADRLCERPWWERCSGRQAVFELRQRHRQRSDLLFLFGTYWNLGARPEEADAGLVQREMGHACEWETSMILRLAPHLVGDFKGATAGRVWRAFHARRARLDHERSERPRPHRPAASGFRGKRRDTLPDFLR